MGLLTVWLPIFFKMFSFASSALWNAIENYGILHWRTRNAHATHTSDFANAHPSCFSKLGRSPRCQWCLDIPDQADKGKHRLSVITKINTRPDSPVRRIGLCVTCVKFNSLHIRLRCQKWTWPHFTVKGKGFLLKQAQSVFWEQEEEKERERQREGMSFFMHRHKEYSSAAQRHPNTSGWTPPMEAHTCSDTKGFQGYPFSLVSIASAWMSNS